MPRRQAHWLQRPGSLTVALRALGQFNVTVLREEVMYPSRLRPTDSLRLRHMPLWVRDVVLCVDGIGVIAARSMTHYRHSRSTWKALRTLGTRPLATLLYDDRTVTRSRFSYAPFGSSLRSSPTESGGSLSHWARSSTFFRYDAPLIVTELFLPQSWQRLAESSIGSR
jgi:chorismate--pyruvate lyase